MDAATRTTMTRPKGIPTKQLKQEDRVRIRILRNDGHFTPREIAARIGCTVGQAKYSLKQSTTTPRFKDRGRRKKIDDEGPPLASSAAQEESTPPRVYNSLGEVGELLVPGSDDPARTLVFASSSGDDAALQSLLSLPQWTKIMLKEAHLCVSAVLPTPSSKGARRVMARRMSNLERAMLLAAYNGHDEVVSTLLAFATQQGIDASAFITSSVIDNVISSGHAAVFKALAAADPSIINRPLDDGMQPLYRATTLEQTDVVAALLELGADPLQPVPEHPATHGTSLLSRAASFEDPRMTEILLEHGVPVADTGALHVAAQCGHLDTMRLLMQHGADVNEVLPDCQSWTPMHFAASCDQVGAVELLEHSGARSDLEDVDGRTPATLLAQREASVPW